MLKNSNIVRPSETNIELNCYCYYEISSFTKSNFFWLTKTFETLFNNHC